MALLPAGDAALLDGAEVAVETGTLVDPALRTHQTDLLLRVTPAPRDRVGAAGNGGRPRTDRQPHGSFLVFILFEHKSYPDEWVALQMLRYVVAIWQREHAALPGARLPRVVPLLLYHGSRRWGHPLEVADLVGWAGPPGPEVPRFRPLLSNLAELPDAALQGSVRTITGLVFLKYARQPMTPDIARRLLDVMLLASADPAARELAALCFHVYARRKARAEMEILQTMARHPEYARVREDVMTYAELLMEDGKAEGKEEGIHEGELLARRATLARLVARRFGLSDRERARIDSCRDPAALDAAIDAVIDAPAKAEVLSKLR